MAPWCAADVGALIRILGAAKNLDNNQKVSDRVRLRFADKRLTVSAASKDQWVKAEGKANGEGTFDWTVSLASLNTILFQCRKDEFVRLDCVDNRLTINQFSVPIVKNESDDAPGDDPRWVAQCNADDLFDAVAWSGVAQGEDPQKPFLIGAWIDLGNRKIWASNDRLLSEFGIRFEGVEAFGEELTPVFMNWRHIAAFKALSASGPVKIECGKSCYRVVTTCGLFRIEIVGTNEFVMPDFAKVAKWKEMGGVELDHAVVKDFIVKGSSVDWKATVSVSDGKFVYASESRSGLRFDGEVSLDDEAENVTGCYAVKSMRDCVSKLGNGNIAVVFAEIPDSGDLMLRIESGNRIAHLMPIVDT